VHFTCACCAGDKATPASTYSLPDRTGADGSTAQMSYPLAECVECGHVQAHPPPSAIDLERYYSTSFWQSHGVDGDGIDGDWHANLTSSSGLWERYRRAERQARYLVDTAALSREARIIDLGSGLSPFLYHCRRLGLGDLAALEPDPAICSYLDGHGIETYPTMLETFIERHDIEPFDAMVISHTVEHLADPHTVISGLARHLRPGGFLYIDVPHRDDRLPYHEGLHLHFFGAQSMARLLGRCGLAVEASEVDKLRARDRAARNVLYFAYGRSFGGRGGVSGKGKLEFLHRHVWRPAARLLGLRINIFVSNEDLRVIARP
jgi:SAM-dependent methyltransferase